MRNTFLLFLLYGTFSVWAQVKTFLSVDVENDFINFRGRGTDHYYTGGNSLLIWQENDKHTIRSFGISMTQLAFTPSDLQETDPSLLDYPYAGLLFCSAHLLVMAPEKKWRLYNTISVGSTGAKSGVAKWQTTIHRLIGDEIPKGWFLSQPVTRYIQVTSQLFYPIFTYHDWHVEIVQKCEVGNYFNRFNSGLLIYFKRIPETYSLLFNSRMNQPAFTRQKKIIPSFYLMAQQSTVLRNRILEESLFQEKINSNIISSTKYLKPQLCIISGGVGFSKGKCSYYFTQQWQSRETELSGAHSFGAIRFAYQLSKSH